MVGRLEDKRAVVVGAGQTAGATIGNGRATAILYAREGATVLAVDRDLDSAKETVAMIEGEGGVAFAHRADITSEDDNRALVEAAVETLGGIDVLQNNVGIAAGDRGVTSLSEDTWDHLLDTNLKGVWLTCKHALPVMRQQHSGCIVTVSSVAAVATTNMVAYKTSKAGLNALTRQIALTNAPFGIRANVVMPGLMDTPIAVEGIAMAQGRSRQDVARERDAMVPMRHMGTAWDVAHASLFLASDEAGFITGVILPVDGGQSARIG